MKKSFILTAGVLVTQFLFGCASQNSADASPPTGFQKTCKTVGDATWTGTKAVGFGLGYVTEKVGQGVGLIGKGVANSGGAIEKSTGMTGGG